MDRLREEVGAEGQIADRVEHLELFFFPSCCAAEGEEGQVGKAPSFWKRNVKELSLAPTNQRAAALGLAAVGHAKR